jgi:6-phospho-beta-glucosidase
MIERIAVLGGSSVYIPEFVLAIIGHNINVKEIVLIGKSARKLEVVAKFCQRILDKSGFPVTIQTTTDVAAGVTGAKYVLNHIRVGGLEARMRDEMLPPKFDMVGDETLGAGGFANAIRTLPVVFELARQIEDVNPQAKIINLTNPMGIIVEALLRYSKLATVGVCDLPGAYIKKIADLLQQEVANLRIDYVGLYHLGWIQDIKIDGRSRMSHLLEILEPRPEDDFDYDLIELFRMIPTRATGMFFHRGEILKKQQACSRFRSEILYEAERQILRMYEDEHLCEIPELTRQRNAVWYGEIIAPLIEAMEGEIDTELLLCVRNDQSIRDLPEDCSVEVPAIVSKRGLQPRRIGSLPRFLKGLFISAKESDRLTVEAVRHKSYDCALQALTINPFVPSLETAKRFLDRIVKDEKLELH